MGILLRELLKGAGELTRGRWWLIQSSCLDIFLPFIGDLNHDAYALMLWIQGDGY